ncbi:MAG: hypothetical protein R3B70_18305 [Polyangiaceae bacterium]
MNLRVVSTLLVSTSLLAAACDDGSVDTTSTGGTGGTTSAAAPRAARGHQGHQRCRGHGRHREQGPPGAPASHRRLGALRPPEPIAVGLSAAGPDQLQSATATGSDGFYAAGFSSDTVGGTRIVKVVKLTAAGLDATFGDAGVARRRSSSRGRR